MTDHFQPTPMPRALERDALTAEVIDSSPMGGILTDGTMQVIHASANAMKMLGFDATAGHLPEMLRSSRAMRPRRLIDQLGTLSEEETDAPRFFQLVESESGEPRCVAIDAVRCQRQESRWIFWLDDVTAACHLRQFKLLAEIGRGSRGRDLTTHCFAERLVDSVLRMLGADIAVLTVGNMDGLRVVAARGLMLDDTPSIDPRGRPYLVKALEDGRPVVGDGSEWDAGEQEMTGQHYIVPLVASGETIGTLHIGVLEDRGDSPHTLGFSRALDMAFLDVLSAYAGTSLAHTRLFDELRSQRAKLKTVVDFIPEGIILFTGSGEVLAVNETAREIGERDWVNMNTDSRPYRLLDADGEVMRRVDWPFFRQRDGLPLLGEVVTLDFGDYQKTLSVNVVPVPSVNDDATPTYVGTMRDITAEVASQEEREAFLQVVSHELRNPLTPLTGFLQMFRKQAEAGDPLDTDLLLRAEHQVRRLSRLVDRVLDLSRIERAIELDCEPIDLRDVVGTCVELWVNNPAGVSVQLTCDDRPVLVEADVDRLEQVLTNLIDNAIKHSPEGGVVDVVVHATDEPCVSVSDQGPGITPDELPAIFDRFFSGSHERGGMGIGLYVTRELVEAHGGVIRVESQPGRGATFEVTLPSLSH